MSSECLFDVKPLATSNIITSSPIYNLNYTSQDYNSMKNRLLDLIRTNFGNDFNDFSEASMGLMLVECWAWLGDLLSFKIDQIANELFIDTVTEPENAFRLAKLVGFKPQPPLPGKAMFIASLHSIYSTDIVLNSPIILTIEHGALEIRYDLYPADVNNNPIFEQPIVIPAGSLFNSNIIGLEGSTNTMKYTSNGNAGQSFQLPYPSVFYKSISVDVDGRPWEEVEYFTEFKPLPQYIVEYDASYKAAIIFGNGKAGMVPPQGANVNIKFRTANATTAEIITGAIQEKTYTTVAGIPHAVIATIKNYTKSEYGYPGDTINEIRRKLPEFLRTQNRAVTGADYQQLASQFMSPHNGAIGKATAALRSHGCAGNVIDIIVLAQTGDNRLTKANNNLKAELLEAINKSKIFTDYVCIKDGDVLKVDINVDIFLDKVHKKSEESIKYKCNELINWFFSLPNWDFGKPLRTSDIIKILSEVKETKHFEISFTTAKNIEGEEESDIITTNYKEIIRPDNINLNLIYKMPGEF